MLLVMGRKIKIKVMMKGRNKLLTYRTPAWLMKWKTPQSSASASNNRAITPPPLTPCRRPTPYKRKHYGPNKRGAIEEKLFKIIEKKNSLMKMKYFV